MCRTRINFVLHCCWLTHAGMSVQWPICESICCLPVNLIAILLPIELEMWGDKARNSCQHCITHIFSNLHQPKAASWAKLQWTQATLVERLACILEVTLANFGHTVGKQAWTEYVTQRPCRQQTKRKRVPEFYTGTRLGETHDGIS